MAQGRPKSDSLADLGALNEDSKTLNVIIDSPKGSRNKFEFEKTHRLFKLGGVLPVGASFPFDFGFIPSTQGGDGDPLDVLVLMDEPAFPGCLVEARLIGVIEAEQTEQGKTERNDRLIAVAAESRIHQDVKSLEDLNAHLIDEIEHFFVSYNEVKGKLFKPESRAGQRRAMEVLKEGLKSRRPRRVNPARSKSKKG
jgi:inorganic pyrophosphatase